jgi:hypothetical protein
MNRNLFSLFPGGGGGGVVRATHQSDPSIVVLMQ